jgi:hypothetical protein
MAKKQNRNRSRDPLRGGPLYAPVRIPAWASPTSHTGALGTLLRIRDAAVAALHTRKRLTPNEAIAATALGPLARAMVVTVAARDLRAAVEAHERTEMTFAALVRWLAEADELPLAPPVYIDFAGVAEPAYGEMAVVQLGAYVITVAGVLIERDPGRLVLTPFGSGIRSLTWDTLPPRSGDWRLTAPVVAPPAAGLVLPISKRQFYDLGNETSALRWALTDGYPDGPIPPLAPLGRLVVGTHPSADSDPYMEFLATYAPLPAGIAELCVVPADGIAIPLERATFELAIGDAPLLWNALGEHGAKVVMTRWGRILVEQMRLGAAVVHALALQGVEVRHAPVRDDQQRAVNAGETLVNLIVRVRPSARSVDSPPVAGGEETGPLEPHSRRAHTRHVRDPRHPHVRCRMCVGEQVVEGQTCDRCGGTGLDPARVRPCTRTDKHGNLTCPHGCRKQRVREVHIGDDTSDVQKVGELRVDSQEPDGGKLAASPPWRAASRKEST